MDLSFLTPRNVRNATVIIALLMPTVTISFIIAKFGYSKAADKAKGPGGTYIVSQKEMMNWIANTDAELSFFGDPVNPLSNSAQTTTVVYCSATAGYSCGGTCTIYTGSAICLYAPGTNCLAATKNVEFCNNFECVGDCNQLTTCEEPLGSGFCYTGGTNSIRVGAP